MELARIAEIVLYICILCFLLWLLRFKIRLQAELLRPDGDPLALTSAHWGQDSPV